MALSVEQTAPASARLLESLTSALTSSVVVDERVIRLLLVALIARGHVLLEDVPGVGKTLLARTLASAIGGNFHRVQFTPDLLPSDIVGGEVYDPKSGSFYFRPGPIFAHVVLADEINRGTPRTQSSLLEAMGEGNVSADGTTHPLPQPFFVIATQNPLEQHGTFPLPESELDRFAMQLHLGRPDMEQSKEILRRHEHAEPPKSINAQIELEALLDVQEEVKAVNVSEAARAYVAAVAHATRNHPAVQLPASPRASVSLLRCAQGFALTEGRGHVLPDDVKAVATAVFAHRLGITAEDPEGVVGEIMQTVPVPLAP